MIRRGDTPEQRERDVKFGAGAKWLAMRFMYDSVDDCTEEVRQSNPEYLAHDLTFRSAIGAIEVFLIGNPKLRTALRRIEDEHVGMEGVMTDEAYKRGFVDALDLLDGYGTRYYQDKARLYRDIRTKDEFFAAWGLSNDIKAQAEEADKSKT